MKITGNQKLILKSLATLIMILYLGYVSTYLAGERTRIQSSYFWAFLILYATWTRKRRLVVKILASLFSLIPSFYAAWAISTIIGASSGFVMVPCVLLCIVVLQSAIWYQTPSDDDPDPDAVADSDYYEQRSQSN